MAGGANDESLYDCQNHALGDYPEEVMEAEGFARDPEWRPLRTLEVVGFGDNPLGGVQSFEAADDESAEYYWKIED